MKIHCSSQMRNDPRNTDNLKVQILDRALATDSQSSFSAVTRSRQSREVHECPQEPLLGVSLVET